MLSSCFNYVGTGPVKCRNDSEETLFVRDIAGLSAVGGGDCPELAFTGMFNAFITNPPNSNSPLYVFTDAPPKDANDPYFIKEAVYNLAEYYESPIFFFVARDCGTIASFKPFHDIAEKSGGHVFLLPSTSHLQKMTRYVANIADSVAKVL